MAQENINLGTSPSGQDGDTVRTALQKTQDNFTELYGIAATRNNLLINGAGQINQRGYVSGTATTAANQYTVDRWKVLTSGQNLSWATANGVATFTAPAGGVSQVVEGAAIIGGNYVLSWAGTATATVAGSAVTSGTPFALPANTNAAVVFSGGTFSLPKLERGSVATSFDFRAPQQELALCQRYYQKSYDVGVAPGSAVTAGTGPNQTWWTGAASGNSSICVRFGVTMRAVPTWTGYDGAGSAAKCSYRLSGAWNNAGAISGIAVSSTGFTSNYASLAATITAIDQQWTAEAEL